MNSKLRLVLLVLALAYSLIFGPAQALAARTKAQLAGQSLSESWFTSAHWFVRAHGAATTAHAAPAMTLGARAVRFARHLVGIPYRWGGASPRTGFDCSGFVRFVYNHVGVQLPHSSYADFSLGRGVSRRSLRPGDLVFFNGLGLVGLYVGNGRFIHAPHSGTRVEVDVLSVGGRLDGARRLAAA